MSVIDFPAKVVEQEFLIGPFEEYRVLVDGRVIPGLTGRAFPDGLYNLSVDNRFCGAFSTKFDAQQAAHLIAQAMAIAQGYSHLGALNKDMPFAPIARCIGTVSTDGASHE